MTVFSFNHSFIPISFNLFYFGAERIRGRELEQPFFAEIANADPLSTAFSPSKREREFEIGRAHV